MKLVENPTLPKEIFGVTAKPELLAQAVRVFLANQHQGTQSALTRAEVNRTRKKLYKQKGTGGARHGDRKAPIFVGGGVAFAPKPRDRHLSLSSAMRKKALLGALTLKAKEKNVLVLADTPKPTGKTKDLTKILSGTKNWLIATSGKDNLLFRSARNISGVTILPIHLLSAYHVLRADKVLIMEEVFKK